MGYSREVYDAAMAELDSRRIDAASRAADLRERMIAKHPRLRAIEQEMANSSILVTRAVLDGGDVEAAVDKIKCENLALQAEMAEILAGDGCRVPNFEPVYTCENCRDTGYANGKLCSCLKTLLREEACRRLSQMTSMKLTSFDDMQLSYYPDTPDPLSRLSIRERMRGVLSFCRSYAENFSTSSSSLLLRGATGTGKNTCLACDC